MTRLGVVAPDVRVVAIADSSARVSCDYGELELSGVDARVLRAFLEELERGRDPAAARGGLCAALGRRSGQQVFEALVPLVLADGPAPAVDLLAGWDDACTTIVDRDPSLGPSPAETLELMRLLSRQGAGALPHAVDGFKEHLTGVWRILVRWGQPPTIATAGLLHSIYATESFDAPLVSLRQRRTVQAMAGETSEGLAFLFCTLDRRQLWAELDADDSRREIEAFNYRTGQRRALGPRTLAALAVIELANLLEQACDETGRPAGGVARMVRIVAARADRLAVPPLLGSRGLSDGDEALALEHYRRALVTTNVADRRHAFVAAARANPFVGEPLIALAELAGRDSPTARRIARIGLSRLEGWGDAWDKRVPYEAWQQRARRLLESNEGAPA